jgi:hypothetical protein
MGEADGEDDEGVSGLLRERMIEMSTVSDVHLRRSPRRPRAD